MKLKKYLCVLLFIIVFGIPEKEGAAESTDTLRSFAEALQTHADALEEHFFIHCSRSLKTKLEETISTEKEDTVLSEMRSQAAMTGPCMVTWYDDQVEFTGCTYYAGWRILRMYQSGQTEQLSIRERQTLDKALEIVNGASGSDLEKERYIYDTLCQRIT